MSLAKLAANIKHIYKIAFTAILLYELIKFKVTDGKIYRPSRSADRNRSVD